LDEFVSRCSITTKNLHGAAYVQEADYIEAFRENDFHLIQKIADKVIEETSVAIMHPAPIVDTTLISQLIDDKITKDDVVHSDLDSSNQRLSEPAA
jgi:hypothetical protein